MINSRIIQTFLLGILVLAPAMTFAADDYYKTLGKSLLIRVVTPRAGEGSDTGWSVRLAKMVGEKLEMKYAIKHEGAWGLVNSLAVNQKKPAEMAIGEEYPIPAAGDTFKGMVLDPDPTRGFMKMNGKPFKCELLIKGPKGRLYQVDLDRADKPPKGKKSEDTEHGVDYKACAFTIKSIHPEGKKFLKQQFDCKKGEGIFAGKYVESITIEEN